MQGCFCECYMCEHLCPSHVTEKCDHEYKLAFPFFMLFCTDLKHTILLQWRNNKKGVGVLYIIVR